MTVALGSLLKKIPRYGIGAAASTRTSSLPTYIRITDIDADGRFSPDPLVSVDSPLSRNYFLKDGDIVIARTGASVGKSYRYRKADGELVFAGFLICITPDERKLDPVFAGYYLQSKPYWDWIAAESVRSGQPGINAQQLMQLELEPPTIQHQREIGSRLSDVDRLISSLERLISKKQAIKQGMMQELLCGKTRLPGFQEPWVQTKIGKLASVFGGGTPSTKTPSYWNGDIPWFTPGEISKNGSGLVKSSERSITSEGLQISGAKLLPASSILVTSRASLGHCAVAEVPVATNQGFTSLVPKDSRSSWFLYYWMQHNRHELQTRAAGSTFLEISSSKVESIPITIPSIREQEAVAEVLRDADNEIDALDRRLESARSIKQGMMQELLTGRTRLVSEGVR